MVVVVGEILIDRFPDYERIGGAPFNFAFHLLKLGFAVQLVTRVGMDNAGRRILDMLDRHGFDRSKIQTDADHPTGTVQVSLDAAGVPQFEIKEQVAYDHLDLDSILATDLKDVEMVYFGSLLQRTNRGHDQVARFLERIPHRVTRFCDINLRPPHVHHRAMATCLNQADLLKLNTSELAVVQRDFDGPSDSQDALSWLMDTYGIDTTALTLGDQGSRIVGPGIDLRVPVTAGEPVVDTVGAGDGFAAILAAGYLNRIPWPETIRKATRFAGRICGIAGAVPDDDIFYNDVRPLMKGNPHGR